MSSFQFQVSRDGTASIASIVEMTSRSATRVCRIRNCPWEEEEPLVGSDFVEEVTGGTDIPRASITMAPEAPWLLVDASNNITDAQSFIAVVVITQS